MFKKLINLFFPNKLGALRSGNRSPQLPEITLSTGSRIAVMIQGARRIEAGKIRVHDGPPLVSDRVYVNLALMHGITDREFAGNLQPINGVKFDHNKPSECFIREDPYVYHATLTTDFSTIEYDESSSSIVEIRARDPQMENQYALFRGLLKLSPRNTPIPHWARSILFR